MEKKYALLLPAEKILIIVNAVPLHWYVSGNLQAGVCHDESINLSKVSVDRRIKIWVSMTYFDLNFHGYLHFFLPALDGEDENEKPASCFLYFKEEDGKIKITISTVLRTGHGGTEHDLEWIERLVEKFSKPQKSFKQKIIELFKFFEPKNQTQKAVNG